MRDQCYVFAKLITVTLPLISPAAWAEHDDADPIEQIVVTAPFSSSVAETALPVGVLSGDDLTERVSNSLGDTLKDEIGVFSSSFGTGVGHPVIRGQSGNRVLVLQNGLGVTDASNVSPDHAEGVEAILADRIEVVRGPSTLLYGSGAVGGVVNVIDNRIPTTLPEPISIVAEQSRNSVNNQDKSVIRVDGSAGNVAFHADYFNRESNNVSIPGFAIDEAAAEAMEELLHDEADEGHDEEEEAFENNNGFVSNSSAESSGGTLGASLVSDNGFVGFAVSRIESDYGLPPGGHDPHHDEDEEAAGDSEELEFVRIDLEKTRYDLRGEYRFSDGFFNAIKASLSYTDYEHAEVEFFEDGEQEVGTRYVNKGTEGRFTVSHNETAGWTGVWGLQLTDSYFYATGEEAFIPETDIGNVGIFAIERLERDKLTLELGARIDMNEVEAAANCNLDESAISLGGSAIYDMTDQVNLIASVSRSERTPTVEELFSNVDSSTCARIADDEELVLHAATNLLEIGNPNLDNETANNIDLGVRFYGGTAEIEFNVYHNSIDDYIFLNLTGDEHEEMLFAEYQASDAAFTGLEGKVSWRVVESDTADVIFGVFADSVRARFDGGGNIPRVPPSKIGMELRLAADNWTVHWHTTRVNEQDNVSELELTTDGYTDMSLYADYHWRFGQRSELQLFARGTNLLNEEIRNHTSLVKNFSPDPGRALTVGLRFRY